MYYDKQGNAIDLMAWAKLLDDMAYKRVAETTLEDGTRRDGEHMDPGPRRRKTRQPRPPAVDQAGTTREGRRGMTNIDPTTIPLTITLTMTIGEWADVGAVAMVGKEAVTRDMDVLSGADHEEAVAALATTERFVLTVKGAIDTKGDELRGS